MEGRPARTNEPPDDGDMAGPHGILEDRMSNSVELYHEEPTTLRYGISSATGDETSDEDAVVGIVVAHRHDFGEDPVECGQPHGRPNRRAGPVHLDARHETTQGEDGRVLREESNAIDREQRKSHQEPVPQEARPGIHGGQQGASQNDCGESLHVELREHQVHSGQRQARHEELQDRAPDDRKPSGPPFPHQARLEAEVGDDACERHGVSREGW